MKVCEKRVSHAIIALTSDGIIEGDIAIGFGIEHPNGAIELVMKAFPAHNTRIFLSRLPEKHSALGQAAAEYRQQA